MSTKARNFEQLKRMIRDQLAHGKELGATRQWLTMYTGAYDRTVRMAIEDLRSEGWLIRRRPACTRLPSEGMSVGRPMPM